MYLYRSVRLTRQKIISYSTALLVLFAAAARAGIITADFIMLPLDGFCFRRVFTPAHDIILPLLFLHFLIVLLALYLNTAQLL